MVKTKYIFPFSATDTSKSGKIMNNGFIKHIFLQVPNFTSNVTATLSITDEENTVIWSDIARDKNASYNISGLNIPSDIRYVLKVTLSAEPESGGNIVVKLFFGTI